VRMVERREDVGLALEPGEALGVAGEGIGEQLEGDVAPELGIPRAIHLTHPTRAEQADDLVRTESGAGSQGQ